MSTGNEVLEFKTILAVTKNRDILYLGMIVRDAPDDVLRKHDIPPTDRYKVAITNLQTALAYFNSTNGRRYRDDLQNCYK